ncbi:MAG TPA: glycerophosphodiester phosphodiesterase family protein [Spirosoma sp.]|nr:glycerophosphodiester phosphodiesterase family protein [Spirosoma sp.]
MNTFNTRFTLFALLGILSLAGLCSAQPQPGPIPMPQRGLCAHRGCLDTHPENTLPAFRQAIALGAQMIEFDLQLTKDNFMVIMHDESVDRTTNGKGKVSDLTLAEIRRLDAGSKKDPQFAGTSVPTFEETLALRPRNVWLNCHLKGGALTGKMAAELVAKLGRQHQAFLTCGEEAAQAARQVVPGILICNAEGRYRRNASQYVAATIAMKADFIQLLRDGDNRKELMDQLRKNQVRVNYYYAKTPDELAALLEADVDFVLVNNLAQFGPAAKKLGIAPTRPVF